MPDVRHSSSPAHATAMPSTIDRDSARREARRLFRSLARREAGWAMTDVLLKIREVSGFDRAPGGRSQGEGEAVLALGGVAGELADWLERIGPAATARSLAEAVADMVAAGFGRTDAAADREMRRRLLEDLWELMAVDLEAGRDGLPELLAPTFAGETTPEERDRIDRWFRALVDEDSGAGVRRSTIGAWHLRVVGDDLDRETYIDRARATGSYRILARFYIEREEAEAAFALAETVSDDWFGELIRLFDRAGVFEDYVDRGGVPTPRERDLSSEDALDLAEALVALGETERALPWIGEGRGAVELEELLRRMREVARRADVWTDDFEEALLEELCPDEPDVVVDFFLSADDVEGAFDAWERAELSDADRADLRQRILVKSLAGGFDDISVSLLIDRADDAIAERGRKKYRKAAAALCRVRELLAEGSLPIPFDSILAEYDDRIDRLPALRDEMKKAGLV